MKTILGRARGASAARRSMAGARRRIAMRNLVFMDVHATGVDVGTATRFFGPRKSNRVGWPGRVRSTGRVVKRQEAAPSAHEAWQTLRPSREVRAEFLSGL